MVTHGWVVHPIERAHELVAAFREVVEIGADELWCDELGLALPARTSGPWPGGRSFGSPSCTAAPRRRDRDLAGCEPSVRHSWTQSRASRTWAQHTADEEMQWGHRFYMKSGFMPPARRGRRRLRDHVQRAPEDGGCASGRGPGDARSPTSQRTRPPLPAARRYWIAAETVWDDRLPDEAHRAWTRTAMADLDAVHDRTARYVNDVAESGEDVVRSVYGAAKYQRLVALKRAWDPDNVFRLNQNIRPA